MFSHNGGMIIMRKLFDTVTLGVSDEAKTFSLLALHLKLMQCRFCLDHPIKICGNRLHLLYSYVVDTSNKDFSFHLLPLNWNYKYH